jgi:putative integral membrane protein (TIGR02587 family)
MAVGALFLSLSVAPTDEVVHIAHMMSPGQELALLAFSLTVMHVFVYFVEFRARVPIEPEASLLDLFFRFTIVGYAIVLGVSLFLLWVFGRVDGLSPAELISTVIVLSFPGAIGAAAARLLL